MHKTFISVAAFLGALSVVLGAFAAHKLKATISNQAFNIFETSVQYQFYHVFALAISGILLKLYANKLIKWSGYFFITGIIFFSGSLYILTYKIATNSLGLNWAGPLTPIGGLFFILAWICLGVGVLKRKQ